MEYRDSVAFKWPIKYLEQQFDDHQTLLHTVVRTIQCKHVLAVCNSVSVMNTGKRVHSMYTLGKDNNGPEYCLFSDDINTCEHSWVCLGAIRRGCPIPI